jgi:hypothetical protein
LSSSAASANGDGVTARGEIKVCELNHAAAATAAVAGTATATDNENVSETSLIHRQRTTTRELKVRVRRATR